VAVFDSDRDSATRAWARSVGIELQTISRDEDAGRGSSSGMIVLPGQPTCRVGVGVGWSVTMPNGRNYRAGCELVAAVSCAVSDGERKRMRALLRERAEGEVAAELDRLSEYEFGSGDRARHLVEDNYYEALVNDIEAAHRQIVLTSPFVGLRMQQLVGPLSSAAARGVEVIVLTKPELEKDEWADRQFWTPLRDSGVRVARRTNHMHEKLVTIDGKIAYHGSLNPGSHKDTTESSLRIESRSLTTALATKYHPDSGLGAAERFETSVDDEGHGVMRSHRRWSSSAAEPENPLPGFFLWIRPST
jgi:hypothetical protein